MKNLLILVLALLLAGSAQAQGDDPAPGITQVTGACSTASLANMPTATSSAGSVGLACADHLFNWDPARMPHLRAALAQMAAGTISYVPILEVGDSTTMGVGAGSGTNGLTGAHPLNVVSQLAKVLVGMGYPVTSESVAFTNAVGLGPTSYNQYDSRIADDGTWAINGTVTPAGEFYHTSSGTGVFTFSPVLPFNKFDIYSLPNTSGSSFTVKLEDGSTVLTVPNATQAYQKSTASVPLGVHTLTVTAAGGNVFVGLIIPSNSTSPSIEFINGGISGLTSSNLNDATHVYSPINSAALSTLKPAAVVIELTINDSNIPIPLTTYVANLAAAITAYQAAGIDVILASGSPYSSANQGNIPAYVAAMYNAAMTYNVPMIDLNADYVSYAYFNPIIPYFNLLHPSANGYFDKALRYAIAWRQLLGSFSSTPALVPPTIASGFGTSPTAPASSWRAFKIVVGSGGTAATGSLGMPTTANGWSCLFTDQTSKSAAVSSTQQTASSTTSVTVGNFTDLSASGPWNAGDVILGNCQAY